MASPVYFLDLKTSFRENRLQGIGRLLDQVPFPKSLKKNNLVAVKIHFGEKGNTAYIKPIYVRPIVEKVCEWGGKPFLTDANTLYVGTRSDSVAHLITALENGFSFPTVGAPLIIADGIKGKSAVRVSVGQRHFHTVSIASDIVDADALVSVAHFKGHELSGFGGTIKNLGMGCASREGKLSQHSHLAPRIARKKCIGCGECLRQCAQNAFSLVENKAVLDPERCVGCGACILACPQKAVTIRWDASIKVFQEKMVEYTLGVLKGKEDRALFINFLMDITPACDCYDHSDRPIVRDIGILASRDPVAIDQAAVDLVNQQPGLKDSSLTKNFLPGEDKFRGVYPRVDWEIQLKYAEEIGLGNRQYDLIPLGDKPKVHRRQTATTV
ncbi:MAG: DUF362 domain-containing protein [Thermodesulfobacteriota bacterium]